MFINILENLMREKNVTQKKLVEDIKIGKNQIKYWRDNGNTPNGETLQKIADYFNVSVDYLLGKEPEPAKGVFLSYHHDSDAAAAQLAHPLSDRELELWTKIKDLDEDQADELSKYLNYLLSQKKATDEPVRIYRAARSKDNHADEVTTISPERLKKLQDAPETDDDLM